MQPGYPQALLLLRGVGDQANIFRDLASAVGYLEGGEVAGGAAELDADEVDRLAAGAVLVGVAAFLQLRERRSGRM